MIIQDIDPKEIVQQLLNYAISPYQVVEIIRKKHAELMPLFRSLIVGHDSPYIRLCAAWTIGELGDKDSSSLLKEAYVKEKEDNVRANIVWALFMINPDIIELSLFKEFLEDRYFLVSLIAIKRLSGIPNLQCKIDFLETYQGFNNILLKLELLRNIRSFKFPKTINEILRKELYDSKDIQLKMELIHAIGATNQIDSIDILIEYYLGHKEEILQNEPLSHQFVVSALSLSQSKPYEILQEIYTASQSDLIKLRIIETLASAGGPKCLEVLKFIYSLETNTELKNQAKKFIYLIPLTIK